MKYIDLINQTFDFPTKEFSLKDNNLIFNGINLMDIINEYGTPLKLTYLPKISQNIINAKQYFNNAIKEYNYKGSYTYCYCTKSSHFNFVLDEALKNDIHIETSSAFDIDIVRNLYEKNKITKQTFIVCNGFKTDEYKNKISKLLNDGFNCIPVLDNISEIDYYIQNVNVKFNVGFRIASDEEPKFGFYTSRLGIRYNDAIDLYNNKIKDNDNISLKMIHFFINSGIKDTAYYWSELSRFVELYTKLKKITNDIHIMDIGGGWPVKYNIFFNYDYQYMTNQIVKTIKEISNQNGVEEPNIFTEFGSYTVAESGATLYSILDQKLQNDKELWYIINGSFITQLPDTWGLNQKYIMLSINNWDKECNNINLGGITCDGMDYYNSEAHQYNIYLPKIEKELYIGFFHTGAYQESLGGYGGIQHCLIPAPKHILITEDKIGNIKHEIFSSEQKSEDMLKILGY
jgi:arginine decarboxylase